MTNLSKENCRRVTMKRKCFAKGQSRKFKRRKMMPKFVRENVENQVAKEKEKDIYVFSDSDEDERAFELGMGPEISDLPLLNGEELDSGKQGSALSQDAVRPLFSDESEDNDKLLDETVAELNYSQFRPNQREAIKRILMGRSTLVISPTGSGKSLCYQIPALLYWRFKKYITLVVSPLISLMEDQIRNIPSSLNAVTIHSGQNLQQRRNAMQQLANSEAQIAFITPEAIVGGLLEVSDLRNLPPIGFICIDEAHCLSEWSHNFRPAYMQFIRILHEQSCIKTFLALTATATKATTFGICRSITINPETDVIGQTKIPENLILSISYERNKEKAVIDLLKSPTFRIMPSIIIYCNRREHTEKLASTIRAAMQEYSSLVDVPVRVKRHTQESAADGTNSSPETKSQMQLNWNAEAYHAGLPSQARASIQRRFIKGEIRLVVATIAFGMGINKANVRAIIHYDMPSSFESYVQEIGRAGRDGKPAQCHMFLRADKADVFYQQRNIYTSVTEISNIQRLVNYLFTPACRCVQSLKEEEKEKLKKLNESDPHEISSWQKTRFTSTPVLVTEDDLEDHQLLSPDSNAENASNTTNSKENGSVKYVHKSIVNKHRACKSHEVAFSMNEATDEINLYPETIITFICQLEKAYPQLQIRQLAPIRSSCTLYCYKGSSQMQQLSNTCSAVRGALHYDKLEFKAKNGSEQGYEVPDKISIDVIKVARLLAKSSREVIKMLKQTEWELNDSNGNFRRSQVRVKFDTQTSFHLNAVGDLTANERQEINSFLNDYMRKTERIERNKIFRMYSTFAKHCIDIDQMKDKIVRLESSYKLKTALDSYFNPNEEQYALEEASIDNPNLHHEAVELSNETQELIKRKTKKFISAHSDKKFTPITIAKIFQGISSPKYSSEYWGTNKNWWRAFLEIDFTKLVEIINDVIHSTNMT